MKVGGVYGTIQRAGTITKQELQTHAPTLAYKSDDEDDDEGAG